MLIWMVENDFSSLYTDWADTRGERQHNPGPNYNGAAGMHQASSDTGWCYVHRSYGANHVFPDPTYTFD